MQFDLLFKRPDKSWIRPKLVCTSRWLKSVVFKTFYSFSLCLSVSLSLSVSPCLLLSYTAWKVSVFGVILVSIFPHSDWIRRIRKMFQNISFCLLAFCVFMACHFLRWYIMMEGAEMIKSKIIFFCLFKACSSQVKNTLLRNFRWPNFGYQRYTNADLKISLYVRVKIKTIPWKFCILNPNSSRDIYRWSLYFS